MANLASYLRDNGLDDTEYWLQILAEQKVESIEGLKFFKEASTFPKLENKVRSEEERAKLRTLLNIDEIKQRKKQLLKLRKARLDAKEQHKVKEAKLERYTYLKEMAENSEEIYPLVTAYKEPNSKEGKVAEESFVQVEAEQSKVAGGPVQAERKEGEVAGEHGEDREHGNEKEQLSHKMLLQTASNGQALQGILLTENLEDQIENRSLVLDVPEKAFISRASLNVLKRKKGFLSVFAQANYQKVADNLGYSIAASDDIQVYGTVTIGVDPSKTAEKAYIYSSTTKHHMIQVGSCHLKEQDLTLSTAAMDDLRSIVKSNKDVQEECEQFLHKYGSHVNGGPLVFGGTVMWTCFSNEFSHEEAPILSEVQNGAILATTSATFPWSRASISAEIEKLKDSYTDRCSEKALSSTYLKIIKKGGPSEAADLQQWMSGLEADNNTWSLIDRGCKLIAIWEIIRRNYKEELGAVGEMLQTAWEKMTGLKAYCPEKVLSEVSQWNVKSMTPEQIENNLNHLLAVKTASPIFWIDGYLSMVPLQKFFKSVVESDQQYGLVKFLLQKLFFEEDLDKQNTEVFQHMKQISDWLYNTDQILKPFSKLKDIMDLKSFNNVMESFLKDTLMEELAINISLALNSLRFHIQNTYQDVLITILIYPFQSDVNDYFIKLRPLTSNELQHLQQSFLKASEEFDYLLENETFLQLQVYLIRLVIGLCFNTKPLLKKIVQMMNTLQPPLQKEIMDYCDYPLSKLQQNLNLLSIAYQEPQPVSLHPSIQRDASHSLRNVLETATYQHDVLTVHHSPDSSIFTNNPRAHDLFSKLGLCGHYLKKLQLQDALRINSDVLKLSLNDILLTNEELLQLPYLILHKIMAYDYTCRSNLILESSTNGTSASSSPTSSDDELSGSSSQDETEFNSYNYDKGISPFDCLLALLMCSSDFLRQDLLSRLAKCQQSVPLILPDPFTKQLVIPLWALCSIIKIWKCTDKRSGRIIEQTYPIVNYEMPIVSFLRLGKHSKHSKSKILNEVISDSHYDHFFNRDCNGGEYSLILGDGLVDMCWYLPDGKPGSAFIYPVTFLNLHGDARKHLQQTRFLSQISSKCFVLITKEDLKFDLQSKRFLKMLSTCPGGVTVLAENKKLKQKAKSLEKEMVNVNFINLYQKNMPKIRCEVMNEIKMNAHIVESVKNASKTISRTQSRLGVYQFLVDEDSDLCKKAFQFVKDVKEKFSTQSDRIQILPLQGDGLWKSWAANNREEYRQRNRGKKSVNAYTAEIQANKEKMREDQLKHVESLSPLMNSFLVSLLTLNGVNNKFLRNYFIQSLKLELNQLSRKVISGLQYEYQSVLQHVRTSKPQENDFKRLTELEDDIMESSIGLEHLLRELGQMYEAAKSCDCNYTDHLSRLPIAAAELLIDGWPLELMDGDAAHVPLKWVTAVLQEVAKMLDDPKVFVLSVVGLQSTGKSTMLNTVFGLQFNVSSGRCTRGAFMQLLPLDEELRRETKCGYVLVVDTEGLRHPALDTIATQKHDNELAAFAIGLANMTLINIYGEVPGDMDDILQTSVHAFLRMKKVNLRPSCQFVHQNAVNNLKTEVSGSKFTQKLDQYAVVAAKDETCEGEYKCFNDVIKFDDQTDIYHFPGLWKGDPPMAPVNHGYSIVAQQIKHHFTDILRQKFDGLNLSLLDKKIFDLWTSLLKEDFVFSFKNTLELIAYKTLETEWSSKWRWPFHEKMLNWERQVENEIAATNDPDTIHELVLKKRRKLQEFVCGIQRDIEKEMDEFFDREQSQTCSQWKLRFQQMLANLSCELKQLSENRCVQLGKSRIAICQYEQERTECTEMIKKGVREHVARIRMSSREAGQHTDEELEAKFENLWQQLIADVPVVSGEPVNVEQEVQTTLIEYKVEYRGRLIEKLRTQELREWGIQLKLKPQKETHYQKTIFEKAKNYMQFGTSNFEQVAQNVTNKIFDAAEETMNELAAQKQNFKPEFTVTLLHLIDSMIEEESGKNYYFYFTVEYRLDMYLIICGYAVKMFEEMAEAFKQQIYPQLHLERNVKPLLLMQFKNQCCQVEIGEGIARTLCVSLEEPIKAQVTSILGTVMVGGMKVSAYQHFNSKMALKARILTDLCEEDSFDSYMEYVLDVKKCLEERIKQYTVKYCDTKIVRDTTRLQLTAQDQVSQLIEFIESKVCEIKLNDFQEWLSAFCDDKALQRELGLNLKPSDLLDGYDSKWELNVGTFVESMKVRLEKLKWKLHSSFSRITCEEEMIHWRKNPYEILKTVTDAVGCTEQCPFCGEQCDLLDPHAGDHRTAIHRPDCIRGYKYVHEDSQKEVLLADFCPVLISSKLTFCNEKTNEKKHPYKKYKKIYPDWHITPDLTSEDCMYWKWFVAKYKHHLARKFAAAAPEVPPEWLDVSKEDLRKYLNRVYCVAVHH